MASSSKYVVRNLWNAAPVLTTNLLDMGLVDTTFNTTLTRAAVTAFDEYTSIRRGASILPSGSAAARVEESETKPRRRRRTPSSRLDKMESATSGLNRSLFPGQGDKSNDNSNEIFVTDNDFFFEHQKNRGYRLASQAIANCDCTKLLQEDYLVDIVAYYLEKLCGAKPLADLLLLGTGECSIDMWAAVQRGKGAYHADHVHEGALVSGVYYASVPSGSAPLVLRKPKANLNHRIDEELPQLAQQTKNDDDDDGQVSDVIISPAEGNLVLFPPWVEHGVPLAGEQQDEYEDSSINDPRVSFAFNVTGAVVLGNDPW
eukprot:CAMPEP_0168182940 /NCGR_PEP_ID=MMETSP0139_2-20121125/12171_1 /TAXON_ID=44445 /ORGANISM="Pseudo-nitzschia australis, Strain 10249 10 AB" /LENGTH=315 /DNA_ID=CAMNT_0008103923 /DNA_START=146 /DNA_END=1090 /DNA_ORIENTATION=-